jgi:formamidopyrimidine-DNA glycosylase
MPELPEVEHAAARLRSAVLGRTISSATALHPAVARSLTKTASRRLEGRRVAAVERRAKIQLVTLDDAQVLEVHFRMTGDWDIGSVHDDAPRNERARFEFTDGTRVSLVDGRALSVLRVHAPNAFQLPALGPEPLSEEFSARVLRDALASRRGPIKPVLLDQKIVSGIGNIYAAEALWEARIHPESVANKLSLARLTRLVDAIRVVLLRAQGERYYAPAPADAAYEFNVYAREGDRCMRDDGVIRRIVQAGRSTYFCAACQRR